MSSDNDDYGLELPTDEDSMQENSQILIENIQSKGNDVKETQQDIVYKKYSDDDSNGNEQNDYDEEVVEGTPQQESFDGRDKRVKRNLPLKFCQDKLLQKYIYKKSSNRYEQTVLKIKVPGEYTIPVERHNKIVNMLTNFELYCPDIDSDSRSYRNVKKILDHATKAYDINKELCQQIEGSMNKIFCLENKLTNAVNAL